MKAFVTGATGFIGRHVARRLAQSGHELCCLARRTSSIGHLEELDATLITGDLNDRDSLREGMEGCDWVINVAGLYSFWEPNKRVFSDVNITGTRNVMECALEAGASKVVHVSTAGIWGKSAVSPTKEDSPVGPDRFCEYWETKYRGDLIAWELHEKRGLPLVVVYPTGVLGPGDPKPSGQYVKKFVDRKMPAAMFNDATLTWVHVNDVAEVIVRAAEKEGNIGERYIAGKEHRSVGELNQMLSEISGVPIPRMTFPDWMVTTMAALATFVADLIKKPPLMDMSTDFIGVFKGMKQGLTFDGSKAERELGIEYTPVRTALEEEVESYQK